MTVLVTADLHLGDNPRDQYRHDWMAKLPAVAKANKVEAILILGDLTEEKDRHGAWLVNKIVDHIAALAKVAPVIVLRGNHDYVDVSSPFYAFLERVEGVAWVNAPMDSQNLPLLLKTRLARSLFLPHTSNYKRDWEGLRFKDYDWIFPHQTFTGANVGFGRKLDGIDPAIFGTRAYVVSGDIHVPQKMDNVIYVGAPYTVDFGDDYKPRMLLLKGTEFSSLKCEGPQKRLIEQTIAHTGKVWDAVKPGDIVKVRVRFGVDQVDAWPSVKQEIAAWCKKEGYVVHAIVPVVSKGSVMPRVKSDRTTSKDDDALLTTYAEARGLDAPTLKVGQIIMRKV